MSYFCFKAVSASSYRLGATAIQIFVYKDKNWVIPKGSRKVSRFVFSLLNMGFEPKWSIKNSSIIKHVLSHELKKMV